MLEPRRPPNDPTFQKEGEARTCLIGPDGTILKVGDSWSSHFALSREEVMGRLLCEVFSADADLFRALVARAAQGHSVRVRRSKVEVAGREVAWTGTLSPIESEESPKVAFTLDAPPEIGAEGEQKLERRFRLLAESCAEISWWINERLETTRPAPAWLEFTGQTEAEARGTGYLDAVHPEDRRRLTEQFRQTADQHTYMEIEHRLRRHDGTWRSVVSRGVPILKADGSLRAFVGTTSDITDRKAAEARLRALARKNEQDRAQLGAVFRAMSDGLLAFDMTGRLRYVNDEEARALGFRDAQEMMDLHARLATAFPSADPKEVSSALFEMRNLDGTPVPKDDWPPIRIMRGLTDTNRELVVKHLRTGWVKVVSFTTAPVLDAEGRQVLCITVSRDVTAARMAEEKLRESEERFRTLADNIAQLAWSTDAKGRFTWSNRRCQEYFGVPPAGLLKRRPRGFLHPEQMGRLLERFGTHIRVGEPWEGTFALRGKDGSYRWFLCRFIPLRDEEGRITRWFGTGTDVTELRRIEEELREANRRKSEFLGVLSHELRNPLAPIRNSLHLLKQSLPDARQRAHAEEVIERQTEHLARMVDELLDVTRISRGKVALRRERADLDAILRAACDDHGALIAKAGLTLHVTLATGPVWALVDRTRISQIAGNLLQNALKFTPPGGRIEVGLERSSDRARISVRDTGIGIDGRDLERLFTPFAHSERDVTRGRRGLGLGLALVRQLVELHGGLVRAESEGRGKGSEFIVELPTEREEVLDLPSLATRGAGNGPRGRSILLIEDNVDAGESLAEVLELGGHSVKLARDGRSGLEMARHLLPDVIVCDIGLPDIDGYRIARELKSEEPFRNTKLIALTGYAEPEDRRRAHEAGFDAHLPKPPSLDKLRALVEAC